MALDCATWRSISLTDAESSSAADAISRTFDDASDEASSARFVLLDASSAAAPSWVEAASISSEIRPSSASVFSTAVENCDISFDICCCRCAFRSALLRTVRLSSSLLRIAFWNTPIERASAPISSLRSLNGMEIAESPAATAAVTLVISVIGLVTLRAMIATPMSASTTAMAPSTVSNNAVWSIPSSICV